MREKVQSGKGVLDPAEQSELDDLSAKIPRLMQVLPDVLHDKPGDDGQCKAALMHMLSRLLECVDASVPVCFFPYDKARSTTCHSDKSASSDERRYRSSPRGGRRPDQAHTSFRVRKLHENNRGDGVN